MHAPRFDFIRELCGHLPDDEIAEAEARFARLLDVLMAVAARKLAEQAGDKRFDDLPAAP